MVQGLTSFLKKAEMVFEDIFAARSVWDSAVLSLRVYQVYGGWFAGYSFTYLSSYTATIIASTKLGISF